MPADPSRALAGDLGAALDPVRLFRRAVGAEPDGWQRDVLRSAAPRLLLNCSRQVGKSTCAGVLAAHTALYQPGSLTLLLSPSQRQSGELFRKVRDVFHALGAEAAPLDTDNVLSLETRAGSRVVSLPGKEGTIRGFSGARLLVLDEAARVSDDLVTAVRPMLAVSGGRLAALSTPFGRRGWFFEAWAGGGAWERYEIPAAMCPRISAAFLAEERQALGIFYPQEYECAFLDPVNSLFSGEDVDALLDDDVQPLFPLTRPA